MLDHIGLRVADYSRSKAFYRAVLAPLGYTLAMEGSSGAGFSKGPIPAAAAGKSTRSSRWPTASTLRASEVEARGIGDSRIPCAVWRWPGMNGTTRPKRNIVRDVFGDQRLQPAQRGAGEIARSARTRSRGGRPPAGGAARSARRRERLPASH